MLERSRSAIGFNGWEEFVYFSSCRKSVQGHVMQPIFFLDDREASFAGLYTLLPFGNRITFTYAYFLLLASLCAIARVAGDRGLINGLH